MNNKRNRYLNPRILLGIPSNRDMPKETVSSILALGHNPKDIVLMQNAMINQCRDSIVKYAIKHDYDYIMWIDDDMVFPPDVIQRLLRHRKDIVSGLYFGRGNFKPVIYDVVKETIDGEDYYSSVQRYEYNDDGSLEEVGAVGFGCVLTKVSVLKQMWDKYCTCFDFLYGHQGEDLSFGYRCKQMGIPIYLDSSVKCGHIGQIIVNENHWKAVKDEVIRKEQSGKRVG